MVIDSKQLKKIINPNIGVEALRHIPSRMQLAVYENEPNKAFVQELDGLGNIKKQQVFEGFMGFWKATAEFENKIKDLLGLQEVYGFEVGMTIQMNQDTKKYKKGDYVVILEVDENGAAVRTQKVNQTQFNQLKKSSQIIPLRKMDSLDFLELNGKKSFDDFEVDQVYKLKGDVDNVRFNTYKKLQSNNTYSIKDDAIGGNALIEFFGFETDVNGQSRLMAEIIFEDGAKGRLPLSAFYSTKNESKTSKIKTTTSSPKQKTDDVKNQKRMEKELKKRPFYIRRDKDNGLFDFYTTEDFYAGKISVQEVKIPNDKLIVDDFFVVSEIGKGATRRIYSSKYGILIVMQLKEGSFDSFVKELYGFNTISDERIRKLNDMIREAQSKGEISPRYEGFENS